MNKYRINTRIALGLFCLMLVALVTACISRQEAEIREARQFSEVSVLNGDFEPKAGDKIAWFSPIIWTSKALPATPELRRQLTQLVEQQLIAKGYQVVADQQQADYLIGAAIVDGKDQDGAAIKNFFRLFPSLLKSRTGLPESMALVGIIRPEDANKIGQIPNGSSISLWRAAISAFVLGERVSPELRMQRFNDLSVKLMKSLPRAR